MPPDESGAAAIPEHVPTGPLWSELRDAIRGTGADYTRIPLRRAVFLLAVPMGQAFGASSTIGSKPP